MTDLYAILETFRYKFPTGEPDIVWDIGAARQAVTAGAILSPEPVKIEPAMMREISEANEWDPARLDHADPDEPGIAAPILDEGQIIYILIDGQHRNARALRDGKPFSAYLLTDQASRACVLEPRSHPRLP
jgi:hypothetical protein